MKRQEGDSYLTEFLLVILHFHTHCIPSTLNCERETSFHRLSFCNSGLYMLFTTILAVKLCIASLGFYSFNNFFLLLPTCAICLNLGQVVFVGYWDLSVCKDLFLCSSFSFSSRLILFSPFIFLSRESLILTVNLSGRFSAAEMN